MILTFALGVLNTISQTAIFFYHVFGHVPIMYTILLSSLQKSMDWQYLILS